MATSPRCLCLVLTLWIAVLRPSAAVRTGSPDSVWWGTKESARLQDSIRKQIKTGNFAAGEALFDKCLGEALRRGDRIAAARCKSGAAGTRMARFDYQGALAAYLQAKAWAAASRDQADLAAIDFNLSSLYQQLFDSDSALRSIEEGLAAIHDFPDAYYKPQLLLQLGRLRSGSGTSGWERLYVEGIEAARVEAARFPAQNFEAVEASGWDLLGDGRLSRGELNGAEKAQLEAFRLRWLFVPRDLGYSDARLGALRLAEAAAIGSRNGGARKAALLRDADRFTERALQEQARGSATLPTYQLIYQRGCIRLAQARTLAGLEDLEAAVDMAERWRAGVPRALSLVDGATAKLEEQVFDEFIHTAAQYGIETHSRRWVEESFQAAELNRALSLKENRTLAEVWRRKLPVEFWEILSKLQAEDMRLFRIGLRKSPASDRFRLRLTEMEAQAGFGVYLNPVENFPSGGSLIHFQHGLGVSQTLLSFDLGKKSSLLWVITRTSLHAYPLAGRERIREAVREFRKTVEAGGLDSEVQGGRLYQMLFGRLRPMESQRPEWLLSLDDALFELPFAALIPRPQPVRQYTLSVERSPVAKQRSSIVYLAEMHSLQVIPGSLLLRKNPEKPIPEENDGRFVAVGDPVYNVADPRWTGGNTRFRLQEWFRKGSTDDMTSQFNRLPGSGTEVEASARAWAWARAGPDTAPGTYTQLVLEGPAARKERFLDSLTPPPAVIHLATHVLTSRQDQNRAFLAFGLGPAAQPELLDTSDVAMLHVPGSLVVMTGCSTAAGYPLTGEGLEGLTRAWSIAGARAVVATQWPVKDSSGQFFTNFYRHLRESTIAEALRRTQVEMLHSGTAMAAPAAWASYQVVRGAQ